MTDRTTKKTVRISQPFSLGGCSQSLEPGVYLVETDESLLEGLSFCAYQRKRTFIHLHITLGRPGTSRMLSVSGTDLDKLIEAELRNADRPDGRPPAAPTFADDRKAPTLHAKDDGMARPAG